MVNYCRAVASEELAIYGKPSFHNCEYGNFIASEASLFMAQCAVSESVSISIAYDIVCASSKQLQDLITDETSS